MSEDRLPWFPCEPSKLLGALSSMKPHVGYTYWIVCLRIYEVGGPCTDALDAIARRTGYNKRVVSDALDVLFRAGKLVREGDGIANPYAAEVLAAMKARHGRLSQSGREGANRKWGKTERNQTNGHGQAIDSPIASDADLQLQLEVERKEEGAGTPAKRRAPRKMIDPNWIPGDKETLYAKSKGFDAPKVKQMGGAFVRHHRSRGTMIADLYATWQTWVENEIKFAAERAARATGQKGGGPTMYEIATGEHKGAR
jgi:hypothetical protein